MCEVKHICDKLRNKKTIHKLLGPFVHHTYIVVETLTKNYRKVNCNHKINKNS